MACAQDESAPSPGLLARAASAAPRRRALLAPAEAGALAAGRAGERLQGLAVALLGNLLAAGAAPELGAGAQAQVGRPGRSEPGAPAQSCACMTSAHAAWRPPARSAAVDAIFLFIWVYELASLPLGVGRCVDKQLVIHSVQGHAHDPRARPCAAGAQATVTTLARLLDSAAPHLAASAAGTLLRLSATPAGLAAVQAAGVIPRAVSLLGVGAWSTLQGAGSEAEPAPGQLVQAAPRRAAPGGRREGGQARGEGWEGGDWDMQAGGSAGGAGWSPGALAGLALRLLHNLSFDAGARADMARLGAIPRVRRRSSLPRGLPRPHCMWAGPLRVRANTPSRGQSLQAA